MSSRAPNRLYVAARLLGDWLGLPVLLGLASWLLAIVVVHDELVAEKFGYAVAGVLLIALAWRALTVQFELVRQDSAFVVRNLFKTYNIRVRDIESAGVGRFGMSRRRALQTPCVQLWVHPVSGSKNHTSVLVHASLSRRGESELVSLIRQQCLLHSIPCSLDEMR